MKAITRCTDGSRFVEVKVLGIATIFGRRCFIHRPAFELDGDGFFVSEPESGFTVHRNPAKTKKAAVGLARATVIEAAKRWKTTPKLAMVKAIKRAMRQTKSIRKATQPKATHD